MDFLRVVLLSHRKTEFPTSHNASAGSLKLHRARQQLHAALERRSDATSAESSLVSRNRKQVDVFTASATTARRSVTRLCPPQCAAPGCQWLFHPGDRVGSKRLYDALPFLHVGKDAQRFIDILPRAPLCECLRDHLFGAWLAPAYNDYRDRYQVLKIAS